MDRETRPNILDTHVWLWLMEGDTRLGPTVVDRLEHAATTGALFVTSLSLWEIAALEAAGRVRFSVPVSTWLDEALETPGLNLLQIDARIAAESAALPGTFEGDPVDALLVAAARTLGARLYSADPAIISYSNQGHVDVERVG
ncbi:MAG: type II toxin-antitoxin system VapC family toxin [Spirochaetota bacterium]